MSDHTIVEPSVVLSDAEIALHLRHEAELEEAKSKLDLALEGASLGFWDWNVLTSDVIYSDRWQTMLGYQPGELTGRFETFAGLVHPEDIERVTALVNDYFAGKTKEYAIEMRMKRKDGGYHWVLASGRIFERTADGKPARMVGIHVDIDARKQAERERERLIRELRDTARFKDEFFAVMSHELRTPLNAMIGLLGIVIMNGKMDERDRGMISRARANSERLLTLINNILDISRMEAGRFQMALTRLNLRDVVERVTSSLAVLAEQKQIAFTTIIADSLPELVETDEDALIKILTNLLSNAIKFTHTGGVTLTIAQQNDNMVIEVRDTGIGIPTHMHDIIFESFRQADASSTRKYGGSGLGLSIVRNLCHALHGHIRVKSEVGVGTTFTVTLPLLQHPVVSFA